jgi:hypothetical protein
MTTKQVFNTSAELNYPTVLPTLDLDFANSKTLDPRITFTRSSGGSYVGADGLIKYAGVNEARFDHNPVTGESLGLLVEEQRTNLLVRSEGFDNAAWQFNPAFVTVSANSTVAPNGLQTAELITADGSTNFHGVSQSFTFQAILYTYSVFAKAGTENLIVLRTFLSAGTIRATFNLSSGIISNISGCTARVEAYPNGWYRCAITFTPAAVASAVNILLNSFATIPLSSTVYLWGAQLEAGAFPTSYIPTTTAAATRAADVASITGSAFSSWYRQDEGTVFSNYEGGPGVAPRRTLSINDATANNTIQLITSNASGIAGNYSEIVTLGTSQGTLGTGSSYAPGRETSALAYAVGNVGFAKNGGAASVDLTVSIPAVTRLEIGSNLNGGFLNGTIRRLTYWPKRLSNSQLRALTR